MRLSLNSLICEMGVTIKPEGCLLSQVRARQWKTAAGATGTVLFPISRPPKRPRLRWKVQTRPGAPASQGQGFPARSTAQAGTEAHKPSYSRQASKPGPFLI